MAHNAMKFIHTIRYFKLFLMFKLRKIKYDFKITVFMTFVMDIAAIFITFFIKFNKELYLHILFQVHNTQVHL